MFVNFILDIEKQPQRLCGLCNQLYYVIWIILKIKVDVPKNVKKVLFVKNFNTDMFKQTRVCLSTILDYKATNANLSSIISNFQLKECASIGKEKSYLVTCSNWKNIFAMTDGKQQIFDSFVIHENFGTVVKTIKPTCSYIAVHFRLDVDCILHYCFNDLNTCITHDMHIYHDYLKIKNVDSSINYSNTFLEDKRVIEWIEFIYKQYISLIDEFGRDNHYYICTPIKRDRRHKKVERYLDDLLDYLPNKTFISTPFHNDREISALIELDIIKSAAGLIGFKGSTFSTMHYKKMKKKAYVMPFQVK